MLQLTSKSGKDLKISYPCVMLNVMVAEKNTNDQYATLVDPSHAPLRDKQRDVHRVRGGRPLQGTAIGFPLSVLPAFIRNA